MFVPPSLAARLDRAEGDLCASIAMVVAQDQPERRAFAETVGGGLAIFAGLGSPMNKMIGAGFEGSVEEAELAAVEAAFAERGAPLQAEVSTLADPAFHALLVKRGYEPRGFENMLGRPLSASQQPLVPPVTVERVSGSDLHQWVDVVVEAFCHPDEGGVGGDSIPPRDDLLKWVAVTTRTPGFRFYAARIGGEMAGGASIRLTEGVAQLSGAATLPRFRRRGVQTSLLRARLGDAAEAGCDMAVVTTQPASKSQENVQRASFSLLYSRQLLVRAAPDGDKNS
jgi:GNAT superfamily N-acetyltransferase